MCSSARDGARLHAGSQDPLPSRRTDSGRHASSRGGLVSGRDRRPGISRELPRPKAVETSGSHTATDGPLARVADIVAHSPVPQQDGQASHNPWPAGMPGGVAADTCASWLGVSDAADRPRCAASRIPSCDVPCADAAGETANDMTSRRIKPPTSRRIASTHPADIESVSRIRHLLPFLTPRWNLPWWERQALSDYIPPGTRLTGAGLRFPRACQAARRASGRPAENVRRGQRRSVRSQPRSRRRGARP